MGYYRISVRRNATENELSVIVHDETERTLGELSAFNQVHAEGVARDMIRLLRIRDPQGDCVVDLDERRPAA